MTATFDLSVLSRSDGSDLLVEAALRLARPSAAPSRAAPKVTPAALHEPGWLEREGHAIFHDATDDREVERARGTIERIVDAGLPAVCLYLTDAIWAVGQRIGSAVSRALREEYVLLRDAWAWSVPRGRGRGWPPHRGRADMVLDRRAPELLNVWVALVDVTAERSCMHVVPLDEDPHYPDALARTDAPLASVRALPVPAGTALVWNANILHWGGACSARAVGPRISCSFSLGRRDALARLGVAAIEPADLEGTRIVDVVADQIATYGEGQPDVAPEVLAWARAARALRAFTAR